MRRAYPVLLTAIALLSLMGPGRLHAQQINTTVGGADVWTFGNLGVTPQGNFGLGQTFTAPNTASLLSDFTFYWADYPGLLLGQDLYNYRAFVGSWNGSTVTSILWQSGLTSSPTSPELNSVGPLARFGTATFAPNLGIVAGENYLAYLFPVSAYSGIPALDLPAIRERFYSVGVDDGLGGLVAVAGTSSGAATYSQLGSYDAAFVANFTGPVVSVPEPEALQLLATGVLMLGLVGWRRRREWTCSGTGKAG